MARIDNINNFLTDVASSIRTKTGKTDKIPASSFDTEISSITGGENLTEELTNYDSGLTTQETSIQDIIEALEGKAAGSGGDASFNIFAQEEEPETKNGIWVKINNEDENNINAVYLKDLQPVVVTLSGLNDKTQYEQLPYDFYFGASAVVGTNIYLFFNADAAGRYTYKYDTVANTYTKLSDTPVNFARGTAEPFGTDIYIFVGTYVYKYNTIDDTYTEMSTPPVGMNNVTSVVYENSIYLFGPGGDNNGLYRYDILSDTFTKLHDIPNTNGAGEAVIINNVVYLFGLNTSSYNKCYKYYIDNDSFVQIANIPNSSYIARPAISSIVDNKIAIIGSSYRESYAVGCYIYDTSTDTYETLPTLSANIGQGECERIGDKLYIIGSRYTDTTKLMTTMDIIYDNFETTGLLIEAGSGDYNTLLMNNPLLSCSFSDCRLSVEGKPTFTYRDSQMYYGDGTQWIKFKN